MFSIFFLLIISCFRTVSSYDDIYSKPEFVIAKTDFIKRSELGKCINEFKSQGYSHELMFLNHSSYICFIPKVPLDEFSIHDIIYPPGGEYPTHNSKVDGKGKYELSENQLEKAREEAVDLLSELFDKCFFYRWGWWTCSVCYGQEVLQFHQSESGSGNSNAVPKPDEGSDVYTLGKFQSLAEGLSESSLLSLSNRDSLQRIMASNSKDIKIDTIGRTNVLVLHLRQGTVCELTGSERTVDIQFYCSEDSKVDSIAWIKEPRSCHYQIAIYTSRLCKIPLFVPPPKSESYKIDCKFILNDAQKLEASNNNLTPVLFHKSSIKDDSNTQKNSNIFGGHMGSRSSIVNPYWVSITEREVSMNYKIFVLKLHDSNTPVSRIYEDAIRKDLLHPALKSLLSYSDIVQLSLSISSQLGFKENDDILILKQESVSNDEAKLPNAPVMQENMRETLAIVLISLATHFQKGGYLFDNQNNKVTIESNFVAYIELHDSDSKNTNFYVKIKNNDKILTVSVTDNLSTENNHLDIYTDDIEFFEVDEKTLNREFFLS